MKTLLISFLAFVLIGWARPIRGQSSAGAYPTIAMLTTTHPDGAGGGDLSRAKAQSLAGRWQGQLAIPGNMLNMRLDITPTGRRAGNGGAGNSGRWP